MSTARQKNSMRNHIEDEKVAVEVMIRMYCRYKEGNSVLCPACEELLAYAMERLDRCRFRPDKPTCRKCPVHCYRKDMRERIRSVMRWSGPRMILFHPIIAIRHTIRELRNGAFTER